MKPKFGIDAPGLVVGFAIGGAALIIGGLVCAWTNSLPAAAGIALSVGISLFVAFLLMAISSLWTKPIVIRHMVASLQLRGNEQVLDVGCGRGLLLLQVAQQLPQGCVTGLDLWSTRDQSGNAATVTQRNAACTAMTKRVQIDTGDMRHMPYADATFDVVVASLAIHNLPTTSDRAQAISEIVRVLKPGGKVALLDFRSTAEYVRSLRANAMTDITRSAPNLLMYPPVRIVRGAKKATQP